MTGPHATLYPIALDIRAKRCIIVGGGAVAERKARGLLAAGGDVTVIAPAISTELTHLANDRLVTVERRPYRTGDLAGAHLAFAASDRRDVNAAVTAEARERGVLVNVADSPLDGDFSLPARGGRGGFTVAVFTSGGSPLVAAIARDRLVASLSDGFVALLDRVAALRRATRHQPNRPPPERWRQALDERTIAFADAGDVDVAESRLRQALGVGDEHYVPRETVTGVEARPR